jgi:hypothetical protein
MLMKLIGSTDPEFNAFSKEYINAGVEVIEGIHTWVAENNTMN